MSEQEMNSYRFISGFEPSDEMLTQLIKEVVHVAKDQQGQTTSAYFCKMHRKTDIAKAKGYTVLTTQ